MVVAEIKLSQVAVQVVVAAMLVGAFHATLEHWPVAFDGIGCLLYTSDAADE